LENNQTTLEWSYEKKTKPFQNIQTENNQTILEHSYSMTFQHVLQAHPKRTSVMYHLAIDFPITWSKHSSIFFSNLSQHFITSF